MELAEGNIKNLKQAMATIMEHARNTKDDKVRLELAGSHGTIQACIEMLSDFEIKLDEAE
jgi:hypothetical protein